MLSGGAPLASDAQEFIRTALTCDLVQGYGLTETSSTACISDCNDLTVGHVGPPLPGVYLKLVNWEEGGYTVEDKGGPRGEIVIGGEHVSMGYFNMPSKTAEDFFEEEGIRYFRTGDIGQIMKNGSLKIIDRNKDLVKLQAGEYVSLGKVESNLKICPLVDNLCVYADPNRNSTVAIVIPDPVKLDDIADRLARRNVSKEELCRESAVVAEILKKLTDHGRAMKLEKFEIPKAIHLDPEPWTPEGGLVTAAFKLKRKPIQEKYKNELETMYRKLDFQTSITLGPGIDKNQNKATANGKAPKLFQVAPTQA